MAEPMGSELMTASVSAGVTDVSPGDWRIDYHVHTSWSGDSSASVESVLDQAVASGLDAICVTDHDTIEGGLRARAAADGRIAVIVGAEITLSDGSQILGIDLSRDVTSRDLAGAVEEIHVQGGLVIAPHPFRRSSGLLRPESRPTRPEIDRILAMVDLVEAHNGRDTWENNQRSTRLVLGRRLRAVAGSDAHRADEVGRVFVAYPREVVAHGSESRMLWFPTQKERHENPIRRQILEQYHRHAHRLPRFVQDGYRGLRGRLHADGPSRPPSPPQPQLQLDALSIETQP